MSFHMSMPTRASWRCAAEETPNRLRLTFVVLALCATHLIWAVAHWIAGIDLHVQPGSGDAVRTVDSSNVLIATAAAGVAAWGIALLLNRFAARARTIWTTGGLLLLALSLLGPLSATTTSATIVLLLMHLAGGLLLIAGFRATLHNRAR